MADRPVEILLVENDAELSEMMVRQLENAVCCRITTVESAAAAMREELTGQHDVLILSAELPDDESFSLLRELRVTNDCPAIIMTSKTRTDQTLEAIRYGATGWFEKPFDLEQLLEAVKTAADRQMT